MYLDKVFAALEDALDGRDFTIKHYQEECEKLRKVVREQETRIAELEAAIEKGEEQK